MSIKWQKRFVETKVVRKMIDKIKAWNRTVLELQSGILLFGLCSQLLAMWFVPDMTKFTVGLWLGILVAMAAGFHMWGSLKKAFDGFEGDVTKKITQAGIIRYLVIALCFLMVAISGVGEPLATFAGIMGLKIGAYIQPFTHKFYNKVFNESDPVPMSLEEYEEWRRQVEDSKDG